MNFLFAIACHEGGQWEICQFRNRLTKDMILALPVRNNKFGGWFHAFLWVDDILFDYDCTKYRMSRYDALNHGGNKEEP